MPYKDETKKRYISTSDVILEKNDSAFIEKWQSRKAKTIANKPLFEASKRMSYTTGKKIKLRLMNNGGYIDEAFTERARKMYNSDMSVKRMAIELGCATSTINRLRREGEWSKRKFEHGGGRRYPAEVSIHMTKDMVAHIDKHVFGRFRNRSAYLRHLVARDLF